MAACAAKTQEEGNMKKVIAVALLLALLTTAAFSQVSGGIQTRFLLAETTFEEDSPINMRGYIETANITLTGASETGTVGGQIRLKVESYTAHASSGNGGGNPGRWHKAYVWWQPIPQLRVFLGQEADGLFENAVLAGWQFHQGSEEFIGFQPWDFWRNVFPGNWDTFGLAFTVMPIQGVSISLILPTGGPSVGTWPRHDDATVKRELTFKEMFPWGLRLVGNIGIPDIGSIRFSYIGPENFGPNAGNDTLGAEMDDYEHFGEVGLSFLMSQAIPGVQIQVGFSTKIPQYQYTYPLYIGAAAFYTKASNWGLKFRAGLALNAGGGGNDVLSGREMDFTAGDMVIHGNIMPYFTFGNIKVNVDLGLTVNKLTDNDANIGWWISPYMDFGPLRAGIQVFTVAGVGWNSTIATAPIGDEANVVKFNIPLMLTFSF